MHCVVALLDDVPAKDLETGQPVLLRRGRINTVVMTELSLSHPPLWSHPRSHLVRNLIILEESLETRKRHCFTLNDDK